MMADTPPHKSRSKQKSTLSNASFPMSSSWNIWLHLEHLSPLIPLTYCWSHCKCNKSYHRCGSGEKDFKFWEVQLLQFILQIRKINLTSGLSWNTTAAPPPKWNIDDNGGQSFQIYNNNNNINVTFVTFVFFSVPFRFTYFFEVNEVQ